MMTIRGDKCCSELLFQQSRCVIDGTFNSMPFYACNNRYNFVFFAMDSSWTISTGSDPRSSNDFRILSKSVKNELVSSTCPPVFTEWSNGLFMSCTDHTSETIKHLRLGYQSVFKQPQITILSSA